MKRFGGPSVYSLRHTGQFAACKTRSVKQTRRRFAPVLAMIAALALAACNEPPRPTATVHVSLGTPVNRTKVFDVGFSLLVGCGPKQVVTLNNRGLVHEFSTRIAIDGNRAVLKELALFDRALDQEQLNGWYTVSDGEVVRQELGDDWVHLTVEATGSKGKTWQPQGGTMPDASVRIEGRFKQIAEYSFGGQTPCPKGAT